MSPRQVWEKFKTVFPMYANNTEKWFENGKDSIRVRLMNGKLYCFSVYGENFKFETIGNFMKSKKKEKK